MRKILAIASISIFIVACSKKTTSTVAKSPEQTAFETTCAKCHKLPNPSSKTVEDWKRIVDIMQRKGKFDDAVKGQIITYLTSKAKS